MPWAIDPTEAVLLLQAAVVLSGGYNAACFGAMWRRMGRQGAAGGGRRGRRLGAAVLALINLGFVATSGAQLTPSVEVWPAGAAAAAGLIPLAAVGAMTVLILRSRSRR